MNKILDHQDPVIAFAQAARDAGLEIHGQVIPDGKIHRVQIGDDRKHKKNGWYVMHLDGVPAGCFGSWRTGQTVTWCAKHASELTPEELEANRRRVEAAHALREEERAKLAESARLKAGKIWGRAGFVDAKHDYIVKKGIKPVNARQIRESIVIPLTDVDGVLHSLQFISKTGDKLFLTGGRKQGCFALLPGKTPLVFDKVYLVEGWATGCSIRQAADKNVIVCFDAGNLLPVCDEIRGKYPDAEIVICSDDDYLTEGNPGKAKAIHAAQMCGARVVLPDFGGGRPDGATDFNDLHKYRGIDAVGQSLTNYADLDADGDDCLASDGDESVKRGSKAKKADDAHINWDIMGRILERYVLIYGTDTCYDIQEGIVMQVKNFRLAVTNDYANLWLKSPRRRMILPDQLVFDPTRGCPDDCVNTFRGFAMKPKEGRFAPIFELLHHLCAESAAKDDGVEEVMDWVLKWLAYPLQHPGAKMRSALVFHGPQGTGKNLFFEIITAIYGKYALVVGQEQLEMQYNDWQSGKLFLIGDEVIARQELYHQKNKLKAFITGETLQIHPKFLPLRTEKNHINVVFLSNEEQPLALEPSDRRYFVVYTPPTRTDGLYDEVSLCLKNGGAEAFYHYLLNLDLGDFNEYAKPIMTVAKRDLIALGLKPAQRFIYEWINGFLPLPLVGCSVEQLYQAFMYWCRQNGERFYPSKQGFGASARKAIDQMPERFVNGLPVLDCKNVRLPCSRDGQVQVKMWIPAKLGPRNDQKIGDWALEAIDGFEGVLRKFKNTDHAETY